MTPARPLTQLLEPSRASEILVRIADNLQRVVLGQPRAARLAVTCMAARGHLLLEDVPGVGKTTLAEALARSFDLSFARLQFTADLLPSDILGAQIFHPAEARFSFRPGPLFHQLVLADELNRAPPRTQSALLEAMAHSQVSIDGVTHPLPSPFGVIATQNPSDLSGTYPLPDSQLDRFLIRLTLGHPAPEIEAEILRTRGLSEPLRTLSKVASADDLERLQATAAAVTVDEAIATYAVRLCTATRQHPEIDRGASTRAALSLIAAAKAHALWDARDFATPADVKAMFCPALSHRLLLGSSAGGAFARDEAAHLLEEIARKVPAPR